MSKNVKIAFHFLFGFNHFHCRLMKQLTRFFTRLSEDRLSSNNNKVGSSNEKRVIFSRIENFSLR